MDGQQKEYFRQRLNSLKEEYDQLISNLNQGLLEPLGASIGELSVYDNHPGDVASEVFERGKDLGTKLYAQEQIAIIEDALDKLKTNQYGICDQCGRKISKERLEIIPLTTLCVHCSDLNEVKGYGDSRPIEEQVIMPPFGGAQEQRHQFGLREEENAFDGEDSWQAVARYGTASESDIEKN